MLSAQCIASPGTSRCTKGESVTLQWKLLNDGREAWPSECSLQALKVDLKPSGVALATSPSVPPGCTVDIGVTVPAPQAHVEVQQKFAIVSPAGNIVGEVLSAHLIVEEERCLIPGEHSRKLLRDFVAEPLGPPLLTTAPLVQLPEWAVVQVPTPLPSALTFHFGDPDEGEIQFHVNGELHIVRAGEHPFTLSLADYLRYYSQKPGTKVQCGEGGCGACTVSLRVFLTGPNNFAGGGGGPIIINACLRPLHLMGGMEVTTIENLGTPAKPHAIQSSIIKHGGSQCGACTPGMVMAIYGHMTKGSDVREDLDSCIQGNLCRCTGYRPIYDAIHDLANGPSIVSQESAMAEGSVSAERAIFRYGDNLWINCTELNDIFVALQSCGLRPHRLVVGNTSTGVVKYYPPHPNDNPEVYINISSVDELLKIEAAADGLQIGASVPLTRLMATLEAQAKTTPQLTSIVRHLKLVAHPQVRNVGSWAGNVMIAKTHPDFPSDVCLLLTLLGAALTLQDAAGQQTQVAIEDFLVDPSMPRAAEIIVSVHIPYPAATSNVETFKVMKRHMNTHAEVNAGFLLDFTDASSLEVKSARIVVGNIIQGPFLAAKTVAFLAGKTLEGDTLQQALQVLSDEMVVAAPTVPDPPFLVPSASYRKALAKNLCYKAMQQIRLARLGASALSPEELSAASTFVRGPSSGSHVYPTPDPEKAPVGREKAKYRGLEQACGTTEFTADTPLFPGTLFAAGVLASQVGVIEEVDPSEALQIEQAQYFITADDIAKVGASNSLDSVPGAYLPKVFADGQHSTAYVGELIGVILADTLAQAQVAAKAVKVQYKSLAAEDAPRCKVYGQVAPEDVKEELTKQLSAAAEHGKSLLSVSDSVTSTGQRHFYLETQTSYARLDEDGQLVVRVATQYAQGMEACMKQVLPPGQRFTLEVPQLGGAYGGKNFLCMPACLAASIATLATKRPVLYPTDRSSDFLTYNGRPTFTGKWTSIFDADTLKVQSLTQEAQRSESVGKGKSQFPLTGLNCYTIQLPKDKLHLYDQTVEETIPPITIMRAPNFFEASFLMECIIEHMAREAGREPVEVQEANMDMSDSDMGMVWKKAKEMMDFSKTKDAVTAFNKEHKYQKQGLYIMGSKFAGTSDAIVREVCLVEVQSDGTIVIDHSGIEMGQGMDTKAMQACVMKLRVLAKDASEHNVSINVPRTEKNFKWSDISPTWGSTTSEVVVYAIMQACDKLIEALKPYAKPGRLWKEIAAAAAAGGASMSAPGLHPLGEGRPYTVHCAAAVRVQIDTLTGDTQVLSCDLAYDCGQSINPQVDVGQMEGSIVQALGFSLMEEVSRSEVDKRMVNCGTWDYKIPSGLDIPIKMNIAFVDMKDDKPGPGALVLSSKVTGEPAQLTGLAAFFAVKDAVSAARRENGKYGYFRMNQPASPEKIVEACEAALQ